MTRLMMLALGTMAAGILAGCAPIGPLLYHMMPEQKTEAQFKLTEGRLLILVDDPEGVLPNSELRNEIHRAMADDLTAEKACGTIVPPQELARIARTERDFETLSVRAIGEKLQADQVLCVTIQSFTTGDQAKMGVYQGRARAMIKVCSTEKKPNVRVWPGGGDGMPVEVNQPSDQTQEWTNNTKAGEAYAQLICQRLGRRVAMLFHKHSSEAEADITAGRNERPK